MQSDVDANQETFVTLLLGAAQELGTVGSEEEIAAGHGCTFAVGTTDGDSVEVVVTEDEANGLVNLCVYIGDAPADDDGLFASLLERNYLGRAADGAVFAVDPAGAVVLQRDLTIAGLEAASLAEAVRSAAVHAASVREAMAERRKDEPERILA